MEIAVTVNAFVTEPALVAWLGECQARLPESASVQPMPPSAFHCTLKALYRGTSPPADEALERWSRLIDAATGDARPFDLALRAVVCFPGVAWVVEVAPAPQALHDRLCEELGAGPEPAYEGSGYLPHVTLAFSDCATPTDVGAWALGEAPPGERVSEIQLVEWDVERLAPRVVSRHPLG